jgi:hypothetical protein
LQTRGGGCVVEVEERNADDSGYGELAFLRYEQQV